MTQKKMTTTFNYDFIQRTLRTTGIVVLFLSVIGLYYFPPYDILAFLTAGVWSIINMLFLSALVRTVLRPDNIDKMSAMVLMMVKFPLLYATAYFIFTTELFRPIPIVVGISMILIVMVLKAFSRVMLGLDETNQDEQEIQSNHKNQLRSVA